MPGRRIVSARQMEILLEFAESNLQIALGRFPGGPQAVQVTRGAWESVAVTLNSVAEGTTKTPDQWRRYWIDFKAKTKSKAADRRRNASATGGGPNKLVPLTELEKRVLAIVGPVAVDGLPGVRLPIDIPSLDESRTPSDSGIILTNPLIAYPSTSVDPVSSYPTDLPSITSSEPQMEVEWLEEEIPSPLRLQPESQTFAATSSASAQPPLHQSQSADTVDIPAQSDEQPPISIEERHAQHSRPPARRSRTPLTSRAPYRRSRTPMTSSAPSRSSRSQRQFHRDERTPRWAYEIETRRIAAEERHAAAMEALVNIISDIKNDVHAAEERHVAATEALVNIICDIRNDVHIFISK